MKRILAFLLAMLLCVGLGACSAKEVSSDDMSHTSIRNAKTGTTLELGMTRAKVEELLGEGQDNGEMIFYEDSEKGGTAVEYENDMLKSTRFWGETDWRLKDGIGCGDTVEILFSAFGEAEEHKSFLSSGKWVKTSYDYYFDKNGDRVMDREDAASVVSVGMVEDGTTIKMVGIFN